MTGSFGSGKTFVASIFARLGARIIDADRIAHEITQKGMPAYSDIVRFFGKGILDRHGNIDRAMLAGIVFDDPKSRRFLEKLTHPRITRRMRSQLKKAAGKIVIVDAPLLIEAGLAGIVDALVVVKTSKERQIARCIRKFAGGREQALKRISSQIKMAEKLKMADFVIDNNSTKSRTRSQVRKLWREIAWR